MRNVKLRDISELKTGPFGTQLSASEYVSEGIPVINVKNLESKTTYAMESKEVEMTVRDNLKLGQVIVELDGNEYKTWSGDELEQIVQNGGNFTFNIFTFKCRAYKL